MSDKTPIQEFIPDPSPSIEDYEVRLMVRAGKGWDNDLIQGRLLPPIERLCDGRSTRSTRSACESRNWRASR
jgi:hypothetical protein